MTTVRLRSGALVVSGDGAKPESAELRGSRAIVNARMRGGGKTWSATFPLRLARWGGEPLPLPAGEYDLRVEGIDLQELLLPREESDGLGVSVAGATVTITAPVDPVFATVEGQVHLEAQYAGAQGRGENAVFFESFYGTSSGCNPRALDRVIAELAPAVTRYWSVTDLSVEVPEGAIAIIEGSPQWWEARANARLLIVNDWLRRRFVRKPGQKVLQTWHGTPLKRLALHRPGFAPRRIAAVIRESRRWDILLAQNTYSARILRRAYAFFAKPLWVEGYPRNDMLITGDREAVRRQLGIRPTERVLLYAPTWRDDRTEMVDFIDPEALAADVDAVVLVRGHSRTLHTDRNRSGARVIDVTGFPETARLLLAADALITDYSSVMFDFSVTGRPMYFLVPDIEHYRGVTRGFYFDLARRAPGPLVRTHDDLVAAILDQQTETRFAARYRAWKDQFNKRDDGRASVRVVERLLDLGLIER